MFKPFKDEAVSSIQWQPRDMEYVEAHLFAGVPFSFTQGRLSDHEIPTWVSKRPLCFGDTSDRPKDVPHATIRILFCKLISTHPTVLQISPQSYDAIEKEWLLPTSTLASLRVHGGTFSEHSLKVSSNTETPAILRLLLKSPQKWEITNGSMAYCHDSETKTTHCIWFYAKDGGFSAKRKDACIAQIYQNPEMWTGVLFLPCIMLTDHLLRLNRFIDTELYQRTIAIDEQLGVTRVGREINPLRLAQKTPVALPKKTAETLIVSINTLFATILFTSRSPKWHRNVCKSLLDIHGRVQSTASQQNGDAVVELLTHNLRRSEDLQWNIDGQKARLQLQLDVFYTMLSQTDNALNARIAVSAGRDSTSMKILALITAAFLPGTFIATLFSMSMFQWQGDAGADSGDQVLSPRFWIYWATAVPLTVVTLCGWGLWWNMEKRKYEDELMQALGPGSLDALHIETEKSTSSGLRSRFQRFRRG